MPKAKKSKRSRKRKRRHKKSNNLKTDGNKSPKLDPYAMITTSSDKPIPKTVSRYKSLLPITVNTIARARKARLEAMKKEDSSEDDSDNSFDDSNHDHNFCVAEQLHLDFDSPIPERYMQYFEIVEEVHSRHSLLYHYPDSDSCSDVSDLPSPMISPETTPVREPFLSPLDRELEDHVSNDASHAPSSHFERELKDPGSNDASHGLGGPMTRSLTKKGKEEFKKTL